MEELTQILKTATASLESEYFHLKIDGGDPVYRERVYCYELYHQMRKIWPNISPYYLNGEVDKTNHPTLTGFREKPDFLVHVPGDMSKNHAIIEVKQTKTKGTKFKKDLEKLTRFRNEAHYKRAIFLIYGREIDAKELIKKIRKSAKSIDDLANIEIWFHNEVGKNATRIDQIP